VRAAPKFGYFFVDADPEVFFERLADWIPFTPIISCSGNPAITLPLHWNKSGLPIGAPFVGRYADEAMLIRLAAQIVKARLEETPSGDELLDSRLSARDGDAAGAFLNERGRLSHPPRV
jgi:Asp-tRNA(Asn)/Glu-tRNA(Gln) amidotransferase A subunit family amidase